MKDNLSYLFVQVFAVVLAEVYIHACEIYLVIDSSPERINQPWHSFMLALVFTNGWSLLCFLMPFAFFCFRPGRRRLFFQWIGQWIPCLKPREIQIVDSSPLSNVTAAVTIPTSNAFYSSLVVNRAKFKFLSAASRSRQTADSLSTQELNEELKNSKIGIDVAPVQSIQENAGKSADQSKLGTQEMLSPGDFYLASRSQSQVTSTTEISSSTADIRDTGESRLSDLAEKRVTVTPPDEVETEKTPF